MDIARTTRKIVKWAYRIRDGEAEWGEWQPASSAAHAVALVQAELPGDEGALSSRAVGGGWWAPRRS